MPAEHRVKDFPGRRWRRSSSAERLAASRDDILARSRNGIHFCTSFVPPFAPLRAVRSRVAGSSLSPRSLGFEMKTSLKRPLYAVPSRSIFVHSFMPSRFCVLPRISSAKKHRLLVFLGSVVRRRDVRPLNFFHWVSASIDGCLEPLLQIFRKFSLGNHGMSYGMFL